MVMLADDLTLALDRVTFARALGLEPDPWQEDLLRSTANRTLLNCCRQSGKSTMTGLIALHRALYYPGSLILCLAPALRQSQELFQKVLAVSGGALMMLSTPFGKRGVFYEEWTSEAGSSSAWERYAVSAAECPRIPPEFLEEERKTLGPWWFAQEYECRFMDTVDQVFQTDVIDKAITDEVAPLFGGTP